MAGSLLIDKCTDQSVTISLHRITKTQALGFQITEHEMKGIEKNPF